MYSCHHYISGNNLIVTHVNGNVGNDELIVTWKQLYNLPSWLPVRDRFIDLRHATVHQVTRNALQHLVAMARQNELSSVLFKSAFIINDSKQYELFSTYRALTHGSNEVMAYFNNTTDALRWLRRFSED